MKRILVLLMAIALIAGGLLLTGCSSQDDELVGTWVSNDDPSFVTTFNADGTGTHAISWSFGTTFNWSTSGNNLTWNYPDHPRMRTEYSITDNVLRFVLDGGVVWYYTRQ